MFRICKNNTNTPTKPEKSSPQNIDKNNTNKNGDKSERKLSEKYKFQKQ